MVTLDLQKAFDTVNHAILLAKMKALGMTTDAVNWFQSYLSDRQQIVDVNGILSNAKDVTCGVPQGSILGPLLFLIYVNDMPGAVKCKLLLYADDSALMVSGRNVTEIETTLTVELNSIHKWLVDNKLSLHLGKTNTVKPLYSEQSWDPNICSLYRGVHPRGVIYVHFIHVPEIQCTHTKTVSFLQWDSFFMTVFFFLYFIIFLIFVTHIFLI